jgi:hypothetical protein
MEASKQPAAQICFMMRGDGDLYEYSVRAICYECSSNGLGIHHLFIYLVLMRAFSTWLVVSSAWNKLKLVASRLASHAYHHIFCSGFENRNAIVDDATRTRGAEHRIRCWEICRAEQGCAVQHDATAQFLEQVDPYERWWP